MPVPLIGPDGREYEIDDAANVEAATKLGYRVVTPDAPPTLGEQARGLVSDVGEVAEVGARGLAQGLSGGLLGVIQGRAAEAGGYKQAEADARNELGKQAVLDEAHPVASGLGEFAGMVLSPINKISTVAKTLGGATALGRIGLSAAGVGVEGALYGAGNAMSDAALGDHDLTAEKMIANVGLGGVLGLAGGGIGAGLAEGFKAVAPHVGRALAGTKGALEDFADQRWLKAGGGIQSDIKKIPEAERNAVARVIQEAMSPAGKILPSGLDDAALAVASERDAVAKQLLKEVGVDDAGGLTPKMDQEEALGAIAKALEKDGERIGAVLKQADAMGATPSYAAALKRYDDFEAGLNLAERDLIAPDVAKVRKYLLAMGSEPVGPKNSFSALNSIKSTLQKDTNFVADGAAKYSLKRQVAGILRDEIDVQLAPQIGADLSKEFLAAKKAFGALANAEKALGRKTSTGADAIRALVEGADLASPSLAGKLSALDHAARLIDHGLDRKLGNRFISPSDYAAGIAGGLMHPMGALAALPSAIGHKILRERGAAVIAKLADGIANSPRLQMAASSFGQQLQTAAPSLGKYAQPLIQAFSRSPAEGLATHMTWAQADPDYAEVAESAGFLPETPEESAHASAKGDTFAAVAHAMEKQTAAISKGLDAVMNGDRPPKVSKVMSGQDFGAKRMRKEGLEAHRKRVDEIRELSANPEALLERVAANMGATGEMAPGVAAAMTRAAHAAVAFLAKESEEPPKAGPLAAAWVPSEAERHRFAQMLETVESPMSVLEHAASGTLVPDQMRALQAVYPQLAAQVREMAMEKLTEPPKSIPYRARLMLSMITGLDVDGTMGAGIALNQQAIASAYAKPGNMSQSDPNPSKLTLGQRTATQEQKRESVNG